MQSKCPKSSPISLFYRPFQQSDSSSSRASMSPSAAIARKLCPFFMVAGAGFPMIPFPIRWRTSLIIRNLGLGGKCSSGSPLTRSLRMTIIIEVSISPACPSCGVSAAWGSIRSNRDTRLTRNSRSSNAIWQASFRADICWLPAWPVRIRTFLNPLSVNDISSSFTYERRASCPTVMVPGKPRVLRQTP